MSVRRSPPKSPATTTTLNQTRSDSDIPQAVSSSPFGNVNTTSRSKPPCPEPSSPPINSELQDFKQEIRQMLTTWKKEQQEYFTKIINEQSTQLKRLVSDIAELKAQNNSMQKTFSEMEKTVSIIISNQYDDMSTQIKSLRKEKRAYRDSIQQQEAKLQDLQQLSRSSIVEIRNVPNKEKETAVEATADACLLAATRAARSLYAARMEARVRGARIVSYSALAAAHAAARADAELCYTQKKKLGSQEYADAQFKELIQEIESCFKEFERMNENNKKVAMQAAENKYNNYVTSAWGPQLCCFHPRALEDLHKEGVKETLKHCLADRDEDDEDEEDDENDEYTAEVLETLEKLFVELVTVNEYNNERAVDQAVWQYTIKMGKSREPQSGSVLDAVIKAVTGGESNWKPGHEHHNECKHEAINVFKNRRRGSEYPDDKYYNDLIRTVDAAFRNQ